MKHILIFLILSASTIHAQVPHIDYMIADEAKSQLQIHGTFGPDNTGFATIENTKQTVRSWSDTMVICDLPDSGAGSGGHVTITQMSGTSNVRMLSIFEATIGNPFFFVNYITGRGFMYINGAGTAIWNVNWRADIAARPQNISTNIRFEISKSSTGQWERSYRDLNSGNWIDIIKSLTWSDSSQLSNSTMTLFGGLDLIKFKVIFSLTKIQSLPWSQDYDSIPYLEFYQPKTLDFDTTGYLSGYHNDDTTGGVSDHSLEQHTDYLINQKILFPSANKNSVISIFNPTSNLVKIFTHFGSEDHLISILAEEPLGEVTASLYSIDGRLLKQEKIFISSAGMYSFDASGINASFGFLVIKTSKGIVTGKVMF